ncbi:MAG: metal-dependent hydrolase [Candidatus Saccharimonadales bacterium]
MAGYKGHTAGAVVLCAVFVLIILLMPGMLLASATGMLSDWQTLVGVFVVAILFGLWPDVDTNSKGQDIFFGLAFIVDIILIWIGRLEAAAYLGLLAMTPIVGKHRGWTHSRLAMLLIPLPIVLIPYVHNHNNLTFALLFYGAAVVGYFSHLLLDGLIFKSFRFKSKKW